MQTKLRNVDAVNFYFDSSMFLLQDVYLIVSRTLITNIFQVSVMYIALVGRYCGKCRIKIGDIETQGSKHTILKLQWLIT